MRRPIERGRAVVVKIGSSSLTTGGGLIDAGAITRVVDQIADLRRERFAKNYQGLPLSNLGASRLEPELQAKFARHTPQFVLSVFEDHLFVGLAVEQPSQDAAIGGLQQVRHILGFHEP